MKQKAMRIGAGISAAGVLLAVVPGIGQAQEHLAPLTMHQHQAVSGSSDVFLVNVEDGLDAASIAREVGVPTRHTYTSAMNGFSAKLSPEALHQVRAHDSVEGVSQNFRIQVAPARGPPSSPGVWTGWTSPSCRWTTATRRRAPVRA